MTAARTHCGLWEVAVAIDSASVINIQTVSDLHCATPLAPLVMFAGRGGGKERFAASRCKGHTTSCTCFCCAQYCKSPPWPIPSHISGPCSARNKTNQSLGCRCLRKPEAPAAPAAAAAPTAAAPRTNRRSSYIASSSHPRNSCTSSSCTFCQRLRTAATATATVAEG